MGEWANGRDGDGAATLWKREAVHYSMRLQYLPLLDRVTNDHICTVGRLASV
jgi:hypothetical protein